MICIGQEGLAHMRSIFFVFLVIYEKQLNHTRACNNFWNWWEITRYVKVSSNFLAFYPIKFNFMGSLAKLRSIKNHKFCLLFVVTPDQQPKIPLSLSLSLYTSDCIETWWGLWRGVKLQSQMYTYEGCDCNSKHEMKPWWNWWERER